MPIALKNNAYDRAQMAQKQAHQRRRHAQRTAARQPNRNLQGQPLAQGSPRQHQGYAAETLACTHLESHRVTILARNLHCKAGEIDILAQQHGVLLFIEVRQRQDMRYGGAAASVNRAKQARLIRAAKFYLPSLSRQFFAGRIPPCRFDVICVQTDGILWLTDAFRLERGQA